jgi:hypothetical protein
LRVRGGLRGAGEQERQQAVAEQSWLKLMRNSGDAHVGQTLLRLARLAESVHQHEVAAAWRESDQANSTTQADSAARSPRLMEPNSGKCRVEGLDPKAAVPQLLWTLGRSHTEVGQ